MEQPLIGLYFDGKSSPPWSWEHLIGGQLGLSGTDGQALWLSYHLSICNKDNFSFFTNTDIVPSAGIKQFRVDNLVNAIELSIKKRINILIFNASGSSEVIEGLLYARQKDIKLIVWCQNDPNSLISNELSINKAVCRVIMVSRQQYFSNIHRGFVQKMAVINNAQYASAMNPLSIESKYDIGNPIIGFIGAPNESKGFHWVCKAWLHIKARFPSAQLWVMGSVHLHDNDKQIGRTGVAEPLFEDKFIFPYFGYTKEEWNNNGIQFLGKLSAVELYDRITHCTLGIVNPNIRGSIETFCVSAVDFQALGIPVIGGDAGGLRETVAHGRTGFLVKNPVRLAKCVIKLLDKPTYIVRMRKNAQSWIKDRFSEARIVCEWNQTFFDIQNQKSLSFLVPSFVELNFKFIAKYFLSLAHRGKFF